ncbi:MAG TPA: hypothetical protein PKO09_06410 [Anaerolineae bacterium]|nr:hypothetical protein [Anaerolineae bacterium]
MSNGEAAQRDSFVVRIWREEGQPAWLGWVRHTRSGEEVCVRSLDELAAFIGRRAGLPPEPKAAAGRLK